MMGTKEDPENKSIRHIRVRFSDLEDVTTDPFIRCRVIISKMGQASAGP